MTSNAQVAERFAQGYTSGKSLNMFIDGPAVYSYGHHFPIAAKINGRIYFTTSSYSNTTTRHKSHVAYDLRGIPCTRVNGTILQDLISHGHTDAGYLAQYKFSLVKQVREAVLKAQRARTNQSCQRWLDQEASLRQDVADLSKVPTR